MSKPSRSYCDINGVVLLDKPIGLSSNTALQIVKRLFNAKKAGHTGSLDPLATGMLPICFGEATKFSHYLLDADKTYHAIARLGIKTTTADAEGDVITQRSIADVTLEKIERVVANFRGAIEQIPSMYSALKHQGQPLYKFARQGVQIERKPRTIQIHALEITHFNGDELALTVHCSKGTYIRNLVEDIGEALGCGAHVATLRRLSVAQYATVPMYELDHLKAIAHFPEQLLACLLPVDSGISEWPIVKLSTEIYSRFQCGQRILISDPVTGLVRVYNQDEQLVGIAEREADGYLTPRRLISVEHIR